jgi:hypothetical protein
MTRLEVAKRLRKVHLIAEMPTKAVACIAFLQRNNRGPLKFYFTLLNQYFQPGPVLLVSWKQVLGFIRRNYDRSTSGN